MAVLMNVLLPQFRDPIAKNLKDGVRLEWLVLEVSLGCEEWPLAGRRSEYRVVVLLSGEVTESSLKPDLDEGACLDC